jgi:peptide/nickel transport system ATP-binding protein
MALLLISHDLGVMADSTCAPAGDVRRHGGRRRPHAQVFRRAPPLHARAVRRPAALGLPRGTRLATIPGRVPELADLPVGCPFADRCAWRRTPAAAAPPPVVPWARPSRRAACDWMRLRRSCSPGRMPEAP